jgi:LPS O-antigen subunit length determinant protein (WzzB/FepE family)
VYRVEYNHYQRLTLRLLLLLDRDVSEWSAQQIQEAIGIADKLGLIPPQVEQSQVTSSFQSHFFIFIFDPLITHYTHSTSFTYVDVV